MSKITRGGKEERPSWRYPKRASGSTKDIDLLEMVESTRNAVEMGNAYHEENGRLLASLLHVARDCRDELRRLRVVAERVERRHLRERRESRK